MPARFEAVQAFFGDRLGGEPVDYTVYVAATTSAAEPYRDVFGDDILGGSIWTVCMDKPRGWEGPLVIVASCAGLTRTTERLGRFHYGHVLRQMMPPSVASIPGHRPDPLSLHMPLGSYWLDLGLYEYAERVFLDSLELENLDEPRRRGLASSATPGGSHALRL